jgi:hypothetical protein
MAREMHDAPRTDGWQPDPPPSAAHDHDAWRGAAPVTAEPVVRHLAERDRAALAALLDADPGYGLFLRANMDQHRLDGPYLRYWGAFDAGHLYAAAMLVGRRATLYASPGVPVSALAHALVPHGIEFTMGRPDLVSALLAALSTPPRRREEHYLAALPGRAAPPVRVPAGAVVRRATLDDLDALTRLYTGTEGFERLDADQLRRVMAGRIHSMRTHLAESKGEPVAAASTSSETTSAAMIGAVWTAPAARNRGYSTAVVGALCRELLADGQTPYLFYRTDNAPAARVYARTGFRTVGRWSVAYLDGDEPS